MMAKNNKIAPVSSVEMTDVSATNLDDKVANTRKERSILDFGSPYRKKLSVFINNLKRDPVRRQRLITLGELSFRLSLILMTIGLLWYFLVYYPGSSEHSHAAGGPDLGVSMSADIYEIETKYKNDDDSFVVIDVNDVVDGTITTISMSQLSEYTSNVNIKADREGDAGFNLQDIVGLERAEGAERWGGNLGNVEPQLLVNNVTTRALYDYQRETTVNRMEWLKNFDSAFYEKHISANMYSAYYGEFGIDMGSANSIFLTTPTAEKFICNLGAPRVQTRALILQIQGCHLEIHSDYGDAYKLWFEKKTLGSSEMNPDIQTRYSFNETTGCRTRDIVVTIQNPDCPPINIPGFDYGCEEQCKAILLKGDQARRLPIIIDAGDDVDAEPVDVNIIDYQLVLDHGRRQLPWNEDDGPVADLEIYGHSVKTTLANAKIKTVKVETKEGLTKIKSLRYETAMLKSDEDDIYLTDNRDVALMYRSAKDFTCLSAPLVEEIPDELNYCEMRSQKNVEKDIHNVYDIVADGFISKSEFLESLGDIGLTFEADSLDMNENQQAELMDHLFKFTDKSFAREELTYESFESQLKILAPYFTTLYDSSSRNICLQSSPNRNECSFACTTNMTDSSYGACDPALGCAAGCGDPDIVLQSSSDINGQVDYHYYDTDPPDGKINYEEFRQALLKIYSNCTYIIEPRQPDYITCEYTGGGQYDIDDIHISRRRCVSYRSGNTTNSRSWRYDNVGLQSLLPGYRECRPFPDYDPRLSGIAYDPTCQDEWCFLADGTRAPAAYYNRSTWTSANYNHITFLLQSVFPRESKFFNQPYFNISDDDQFREFAGFFFSKTDIFERVNYETFDNNMQSLKIVNGIGENYYLFNPDCFKGKFLKVRPNWHVGQTEASEHAIKLRDNGAVETARFPNFAINADSDALGSCPPEWGNPLLGKMPQTNQTFSNGTWAMLPFSYFDWADISSGVGFKWGKSLPHWCLDEKWPDGGINGYYPFDVGKYGTKAGQPIIAGCEPIQCSGTAEVEVLGGSIHAQTFPFTFDARNETGHYRTMVQNCNSTTDGSSLCFYKGYEDSFTFRMNKRSIVRMEEWRDEYGKEEDPDFVGSIFVRGHGIPNFAKWFWSTRSIYLEFEPSWVRIFSGTVLGPETSTTSVHITPGFCDINYGAVEDIDWRDPCFRPSSLVSETSTVYDSYASDDKHCSTLLSDSMRGLREERDQSIFVRLRNQFLTNESIDIRGAMAKRTVSRELYPNEFLFRSPNTASTISDAKNLQWRHKRVCVPDTNCFEFFVYKDNCQEPRFPLLVNATSLTYVLSDCTSADGVTSPCVDGNLLPSGGCTGLSKNELSYLAQFGTTLFIREGNIGVVSPSQVYNRWSLLQKDRYTFANVTTYHEHFEKIQLANAQYTTTDLHNSWLNNDALLACVTMSMILAALCGIGSMCILITIGIKKLEEVGETLRKEEVIKGQNRRRKRDKVIELLEVKYAIRSQMEIRDLTFSEEVDEHIDPQILKFSQAKRDSIEEFMTDRGWTEKTLISSMKVDEMANAYLEHERKIEEFGSGSERIRKLSGAVSDLVGDAFEGAVDVVEDTYLYLSKLSRDGTRFQRLLGKIGIILLSILNYIRKVFSTPFPSPFATVEKFVKAIFRIYMVDSVATFVKKKCIVDHELDVDEVINLGGSLLELPEFIAGKRVLRLGMNHEVGIGRTIMGRNIRYRVKYVNICIKEKTALNPKTNKEKTYLVAHVEEGRCTYINDTMEPRKWEENIDQLKLGKGRSYDIPSHLDPNGNGGRTIEFIIMGHKYTRTVQIDCCGTVPKIGFKTILRNVTPAYSKFCNDHGFFERDLKRYDKKFNKLNVNLSMRLQTFVRGIKLKTRADKEEERKELTSMLTLTIDQAIPIDAEEQLEDTFTTGGSNKLSDYLLFAKTATVGVQKFRRKLSVSENVSSEGGFMIGNKNLLSSQSMSHQSPDHPKVAEDGKRFGQDDDDDDDDDDNDDSDMDTASQSSGGSYQEECFKTDLESLAPANKLAVFILAQYKVTNQGMDIEEIEVFRTRYQKWCKKNNFDSVNLDEESLSEVGISVETKHFYDVYGLIVSERTIVDNADGYNIFVSLSMQVVIVLGQLILVIVPPIGLIAAVLGQQEIHRSTMAMFPVLEFNDVQNAKGTNVAFESLSKYGLTDVSEAIFYICVGYYFFSTSKLLIYYLFYKYDKTYIRTVLKCIFYLYLVLILSMTISYVFLILSWLILGAVIKPEVFLPYCVGTMTVGAYAKAKSASVTETYHKYKKKAMAAAGAAFTLKVAQALKARQGKSDDNAGDSSALSLEGVDEPYEIYVQCCSQDDVMSYDDFSNLLDKVGVDLIEDKRRMFFAQVDKDGSGHLQYREFEEAWTFLQSDAADAKLRELGITRSKLVFFCVYSVFLLCLIIGFIFIGVATFIGAGTLGAVVNSALTASSAVGMANSEDDSEDEETNEELGKVEV